MKTWALWLVVAWGGDGRAVDNEAISNLPAAITTLPARPDPTARPAPEPTAPQTRTIPPARRVSPRSQNSRFVDRSRAEPSPADTGEPDAKPDEKKPSEGKLAASSRRLAWWSTTALGLAIVLAVIYAGGRALRAFVPGMRPDDIGGPVHVLYRAVLTPRQSACLIRCGDRLLLVGVGSDQMTTLAEITDPTEIDYLKGQCMQARPRSTTRAFRDLFKRSGEVWNEEETPPSTAKGIASTPPRVPTGTRHFAQQLHAARAKVFGGKERAG